MEGKDWNSLFKRDVYVYSEADPEVVNFANSLDTKVFHKVLDLGCGNGRHMKVFAEKGVLVVGIDFSNYALSMAENLLMENKLGNFILIKHDIDQLPFPTNHFDALISTGVIQHNTMQKIRKIITEIKRAVRKHGRILVTVASMNHHEYGKGRRVGKNTFVILSGEHKGLLRHYFARNELRKLFDGFKILSLSLNASKSHWILTAEKK
jgi:cyclopropane fatty-acyl-phospholipid synthase-like methyltransferase